MCVINFKILKNKTTANDGHIYNCKLKHHEIKTF